METLHKKLIEQDKRHFFHPTTSIKEQQEKGPRFIFTKGAGAYLYTTEGEKILDGMSSLWNVNVGHGRKELAQAAAAQMEALAFSSCFSTYSNEPAIRLASKLSELAPGDLSAVFFTSGGSESNDSAYKLARHYWILKGKPEKKKIISREKSYHGVAMGATSATGLKPFRDFTNSLAPDFLHADQYSSVKLKELIVKEGPETIAAFIAEPVQGAGGVHLPEGNYFKEVREICDEYGILFITDEVITGFGRTGKWFGIEHYGVSPDLMCFAKGITSGYIQLGGVMLSARLFDDFKQLSVGTLMHGYTYSGHPVACAVALRNLEIIEEEGLIANAAQRGTELLDGLREMAKARKSVKAVKGLGLMAGIEFGGSTAMSPAVVEEASRRGLLCRAVVAEGQDIVVMAPPLTISQSHVNEILSILDSSIQAMGE